MKDCSITLNTKKIYCISTITLKTTVNRHSRIIKSFLFLCKILNVDINIISIDIDTTDSIKIITNESQGNN